MTPLEDHAARELLSRATQLEERAIDWIYRSYLDRIHRYLCYRLGDSALAEDVTGEVFLKMLDSLPRFRVPASSVLAQFTSWLYRIAYTCLVDYVRGKELEEQAHREAGSNGLTAHGSLDGWHDPVLNRQEIVGALVELTPEQQQVIFLRFYEELSLAEVADAMGKSMEAVKGLQKRGLRVLGRTLAPAGYGAGGGHGG